MARPSTRLLPGTLAVAASLALIGLPAAARKLPSIQPRAAIQALGGLAGPLEAEGWTLTPMRGASVQPGDIIDPVDNQVQISGADCFAPGAIRTGAGVSASLHEALSVGGGARLMPAGGGAKVGHSLDVGIASVELAELPVTALKPSPHCIDQLSALAGQGYAVNDFVVLQSVLFADLTLAACLEAGVDGKAHGVGSLEVSAEDCRGMSATRTALGIRTEPLGTALGLAGVSFDGPPALVEPPPKRKKPKRNGPPCWIEAPCEPYLPSTHVVSVGKGPTMAAADQQARASLLAPFDLRARGVLASVGATDTDRDTAEALRDTLMAAIVVSERHQGDATFYSLATLDRAALAQSLKVDIDGAERQLAKLDAPDPLEAARALCAAVPVARENAFRHAQLSALEGRPSRPSVSYADLVGRCDAARAALLVAVPPGRLGDVLAEAVAAQGFAAVAPDHDGAHIRITTRAEPLESTVSGFVQVSFDGVASLSAKGLASKTVNATGSGASKDADKARRTAERDLEDQLALAVVTTLQEWL